MCQPGSGGDASGHRSGIAGDEPSYAAVGVEGGVHGGSNGVSGGGGGGALGVRVLLGGDGDDEVEEEGSVVRIAQCCELVD